MLPEIEAALALAALATCPAPHGGAASRSRDLTLSSSEDEAAAAFRGNKYGMATSGLISGLTDRDAPTKLCNRSNRWNSRKRENLTEDDKEARRLRRVLANRESALQTIRRRKAMHMELIRKTVDLSEENENLKMEKKLAVEAYNSLKSRNKFLRLQVANAKKAESREIEEQPKSSQAEKHTSATMSSPMSVYHRSSVIPFFCPSVPISNVIHLQYPSLYDFTSLSESSLQHRDMSSLHPAPDISLGGTGPGNSLYVFPLPWVLPFPSYGPMLPSCSDTERRTSEILSTHQCSTSLSSENLFVVENNELSSKPYMLMKASTTSFGSGIGAGSTLPVSNGDHYTGLHSDVTRVTPENLSYIRPTRNLSEDDTNDPYAGSAMYSVLENFPKNKAKQVICGHQKPVNVFSPIEARMRRKELMVLRNVKYHQTHTHSANS